MFSTKKAIFVSAHGLAVMSFDRGLFQDNISAESSYAFVSGAKPKVVASSSASEAKDATYYRLKEDAGNWTWGIVRRDCAATNDHPCHTAQTSAVEESAEFKCEVRPGHMKTDGSDYCKDVGCWTDWMTECFVHTIRPQIDRLPKSGDVQAAVLTCTMNYASDCGIISVKLYQGDMNPGKTGSNECINDAKLWVNSCSAPKFDWDGAVSYTFLLNDVLPPL